VRQFARPFPLERLSLEARVLYTAFLVFLAAGLGSAVWLYASSFGGLGGEAASAYYLGDAPTEAPAAADGPALDLPDEGAAGSLRLAQSPRQVMETFHFHLFTVPVVLLIVGHLFMLTSLGMRTKAAIIAATSISTFVHLVAPLAIRFGGESLGWLMPASVIAASLGWLPLIAVPLWEMWRRLPARADAKGPEAAPR